MFGSIMCVTWEITAMGERCGKDRGVGVAGKHCVHPWGHRSCPHELGPQPAKSCLGKSDGRGGGLEKHEFYTTTLYLPV